MSLNEIIILAIALGIDCLIVSFCQGLILKSDRLRNSAVFALTMGLCQGLMPVFSYYGVEVISKYITLYAKWLVFAIFLTLGLKFIYEAFQQKNEIHCLGIKCLITMGIATGIDALASGVSLNLTGTPLFKSALIIGILSFYMSLNGFWFGIFFKKLPSKFLEISGGLILIILAFKGLL